MFVLEPLSTRMDHTLCVTTKVIDVKQLTSLQELKKYILSNSKRLSKEEYRVARKVDAKLEGNGDYIRGDYVRFNFNGTIHSGKICNIDIDGGGIFWGVMTSYDITGVFNHREMTYKHVPLTGIIELIKPRKNFYI